MRTDRFQTETKLAVYEVSTNFILFEGLIQYSQLFMKNKFVQMSPWLLTVAWTLAIQFYITLPHRSGQI